MLVRHIGTCCRCQQESPICSVAAAGYPRHRGVTRAEAGGGGGGRGLVVVVQRASFGRVLFLQYLWLTWIGVFLHFSAAPTWLFFSHALDVRFSSGPLVLAHACSLSCEQVAENITTIYNSLLFNLLLKILCFIAQKPA